MGNKQQRVERERERERKKRKKERTPIANFTVWWHKGRDREKNK